MKRLFIEADLSNLTITDQAQQVYFIPTIFNGYECTLLLRVRVKKFDDKPDEYYFHFDAASLLDFEVMDYRDNIDLKKDHVYHVMELADLDLSFIKGFIDMFTKKILRHIT